MIKFRKFRWMQEGQGTVAFSVKLLINAVTVHVDFKFPIIRLTKH
jgi:hypothetical protein